MSVLPTVQSPRSAKALLHSRLARRIVALFAVAAGVPVIVISAFGLQAIDALSDRMESRERSQTVTAVGRQVQGRLLDAQALLAAWPATLVRPAEASADASTGPSVATPGLGRVFRQAVLLESSGAVRWSGRAQTVGAAEDRLEDVLGTVPPPSRTRTGAQLLARERNGSIRLLMIEAAHPDGSRWVAELQPEHLWAPVSEASREASWCVQDAQGLQLYCPVPVARTKAQTAAADPATDRMHVGTRLSLNAEFGVGDWQIDMVRARSGAVLAGLPLTGALFGTLLGAMLVAGGLSYLLVRRTLLPLQLLREGARQVERREPGARVDVVGQDEFADLALAFNEMATRVDDQFRSLELLAAIDRDIVAHRAVDEVFRRVLVQGLRSLGATVMGLARVEAERVPRIMLQWNDEAYPHKVRRTVRALSPLEHQTLLGVVADTHWPVDESMSSTSWCAPLWHDRDHKLLAFPLRWQGSTHGLLLLGWKEAPSVQRLREVAELRDRLSVALSSHQRERELTWQARHDDLTGLFNRNGLHQELDLLLGPESTSRGTGGPLAVLFVDLDHFKTVNDSLGHGQGDELLRQAADRLEACAPTRSIAARPGGDEFVLVLPDATFETAVSVATAVCRRMALPFILSGKEYFLGASVGIALAPDHGHTRTTLLRHADMAMYTAKDAGRGRHAMFTEPLDALLVERNSLLADLRQAVARNELVLYFQPRVVADNGAIASAEALIRWQHPTRGLLSPGLFIPLAEESDLIESIGVWVIRAACAQLACWRREGVPLKRLSVNVSPRQLQSTRLVEEVELALVQHGVPWNLLELEVTESLLVGDARAASEQLSLLRERGVMIALDDFGTGYSSMATLRNLPIDVMKVDRAFVQDLCTDSSALAVTRAILTLAKSLGKHTVAEGIETQAQAETLRGLGCDELQGFLFSKPVPAEEFAALCLFNAQAPVAPAPSRVSAVSAKVPMAA